MANINRIDMQIRPAFENGRQATEASGLPRLARTKLGGIHTAGHSCPLLLLRDKCFTYTLRSSPRPSAEDPERFWDFLGDTEARCGGARGTRVHICRTRCGRLHPGSAGTVSGGGVQRAHSEGLSGISLVWAVARGGVSSEGRLRRRFRQAQVETAH